MEIHMYWWGFWWRNEQNLIKPKEMGGMGFCNVSSIKHC
jgi:hypothetical protein